MGHYASEMGERDCLAPGCEKEKGHPGQHTPPVGVVTGVRPGHLFGCDFGSFVTHDGPCRCRCSKPVEEPNPRCVWHEARGNNEKKPPPELRVIDICPSLRVEGDFVTSPRQWFYRVKSASDEFLYSSYLFEEQKLAIEAARHEHEGRAKFAYVLKYIGEDGDEVKEVL